jgi:hypothetical protein
MQTNNRWRRRHIWCWRHLVYASIAAWRDVAAVSRWQTILELRISLLSMRWLPQMPDHPESICLAIRDIFGFAGFTSRLPRSLHMVRAIRFSNIHCAKNGTIASLTKWSVPYQRIRCSV